MIAIGNILVSDEVVEEHFICHLDKCKGACCWKGDFGAPLELTEKQILDDIYPEVKEFLTKEGRKQIETNRPYRYYRGMASWGTELLDNGACAFMTKEKNGIAACGIEKAYKAGKTDFQKPISCHLYPLRVQENKTKTFTAINYDRWDICKAACALGESEKLPVYRFIKDALIRKFGKDFYESLEKAAGFIKQKTDKA